MQKTAYGGRGRMPGWLVKKKLLMVMKMTAFLLLVCCLHVTATTSSQTVTITGKNLSPRKVFMAIEEQAGYFVSGNVELLKEVKPVSVSVQDMPVAKLLELILAKQHVGFHIDGKDIILFRKTPELAEQARVLYAQPVPPVTGTVVDSAGKPLAGAAIRVKGRNISTVTDERGAFSIIANPGEVLVVTFVGFTTSEYKVTGSKIFIAMIQETTDIADFAINVNTGYQSIPRERATGSYSVIGAKRLENKLRPDLKAALEGQISGFSLMKDGSMEIRGVSTFSAERTPLIIVDGYPISGGLETVNVDNVESVTVLKDAVAASIYGSRSSNGVIVITTKQGRKGEMNLEYRGTAGIGVRPNLSYLNRANAADYVDAEMELYKQSPNSFLNQYNNYAYLSRVNYLMVAKAQGLIPAADVDNEIAKLKTNDGLGQLQQYLFRNQLSQQHNLSLTGGTDKNMMSANVKYIGNRGNTLYTNDSRVIFDLKNDWKPAKGITVRLLSNVNYSTSAAPLRTTPSFLDYYSNTFMHPYDLVADPATGEPQDIHATNPRKLARYAAIPGLKPMNYNPLNDLGLEMKRIQDLQLRLGGTINVAITDGLTVQAGGTWTRGNSFTRDLYSKDSYRMRLAYNDGTSVSNSSKHYIPEGDVVAEARNINQAYTVRAQVNYNKLAGKHSVIAIAGAEVSKLTYNNNTLPTRVGYNDRAGTFSTFNYADYTAGLYNADILGSSMPLTSIVNVGSYSLRDNRFVSWYANGSYEYNQRFLVSGSIRLDQTNFFGTNPDYRYKPLWSAGGTYKLSNEKFFNSAVISKWYLRGSYGINGNISLNSGPFLIIEPVAFSNLTGDIGYRIASPPNNELRWEKTITTNFGTDLSFFKSRLNLTIDYYLRKSKDLLAPDAIDPTLGYTSLTKNVGRVNNTGVELTLEGDVLRKKDFTWNVLGTASYNKNRVVEYNVNYTSATSFLVSVNRKEFPANAVFSYPNAGLNSSGSPVYLNAKGSKVDGTSITVPDLVYSGTLRPKFAYGLTNTFRYKSFDLAFMIVAKTGAVMRKNVYDGSNISHKDVAKRWRKAGDENNSIYPVLSSSSLDAFYFPYSDMFVESADFLKLRDLSLTYHFAKRLLSHAHIKNASVTVQGRNLLMLTRNSDKRDPEAAELIEPGSQQAELGFTPFRPMPEYYLSLRVNF